MTAAGCMTESENAESVEWKDEDDRDPTGMIVPQADDVTDLPIYSVTDHFHRHGVTTTNSAND